MVLSIEEKRMSIEEKGMSLEERMSLEIETGKSIRDREGD
jgi:hypothetical protein